MRQCGDCQLCCKLLPVHDNHRPAVDALHKDAGERCPHQKHRKGCMVYNKPEMPLCCRAWNCRWIVDTVPKDIGRPDRVHYVIDFIPDFITLNTDGNIVNAQVVQIWCDPGYPDAHRDPALRRWLEELAKEDIVGLVRFNAVDCLCIFPPALSADRQWHEVSPAGMRASKTHTIGEIITALGGTEAIGQLTIKDK